MAENDMVSKIKPLYKILFFSHYDGRWREKGDNCLFSDLNEAHSALANLQASNPTYHYRIVDTEDNERPTKPANPLRDPTRDI